MKKSEFYFYAYGRKIVSDIALSAVDIPAIPSAKKILVCRSKQTYSRKTICFHEVRDPSGAIQCRFGKTRGGYTIDFSRLARFFIRSDGGEIHYDAPRSILESDIAALLLTQALPIALHIAGLQVLHACSVRIDDGAIALLGRQGQGKSTLAAAFSRKNFSVLSDDALPIFSQVNQIWAMPAIPEIRLYRRTGIRVLGRTQIETALPALQKWRTDLGSRFQGKPLPLRALFILKTGKELRVQRLSPSAAFHAALSSSFRMDIDDEDRLKKELMEVSNLVERVPVFCLEYPRGLQHLDSVVRKIVRDTRRTESARGKYEIRHSTCKLHHGSSRRSHSHD